MPRKRKTPTGANAQPIQVPTGGSYGSRKAMEEAQRAIALSAGPVNATPTPAPTGAPQRTAIQAADETAPPSIIPLSAPTNRPDEPFTAGLPVGPGPGATPMPVIENVDLLRQWMPALERLASSPDASMQTRNAVRFLRSNV